MAVDSVTPLAEKLPIPKGELVIAVYVVGSLLLGLVAFAAGLFARSLEIKRDAVSFFDCPKVELDADLHLGRSGASPDRVGKPSADCQSPPGTAKRLSRLLRRNSTTAS